MRITHVFEKWSPTMAEIPYGTNNKIRSWARKR